MSEFTFPFENQFLFKGVLKMALSRKAIKIKVETVKNHKFVFLMVNWF